MAYLYGSGHETVDRMANFAITGNVVPQTWYRTILRETGKPHLLAIMILSDIVYWYRPKEVRDEVTGHFGDMKNGLQGTSFRNLMKNTQSCMGKTERA